MAKANRKTQSIYHRVEHINPKTAARYLEDAATNRKLSEVTIVKYTGAMNRGQWGFGTIHFDSKDRLNDGQHRMHAVIRSGTTQEFLVIRGNDDFAHMDQGKSRSAGDILGILGYKNTNVLAAIVRAVLAMEVHNAKWPGGSGGTVSAITIDDIIQRLEKEPHVLQSLASEMSSDSKPLSQLMKSAASSGWFLYTIRKGMLSENHDVVDCFINTITGKLPAGNGDPALTLYRRLNRNDEITNRLSREERAALVVKAWNAYVSGKEITRLSWRKFGEKAEEFPKLILDRNVAAAGIKKS